MFCLSKKTVSKKDVFYSFCQGLFVGIAALTLSACSWFAGDDPEADISGAKNAGIDQVFFNPYGKVISITPTFEIKSFDELTKIL